MDLTLEVVANLDRATRAQWDGLGHGPSPFLRSGFLRALQESGSIGAESGWVPYFLLVRAGRPVSQPEVESDPSRGDPAPSERARDIQVPPTVRRSHDGPLSNPEAAPLDRGSLLGGCVVFFKTHSYGEYIFDWSWARACAGAGIPYYPKLVLAAPLTPATGHRMLLADTLDANVRAQVREKMQTGVRELAEELDCQSIHWLFVTPSERTWLETQSYVGRTTHQFHWKNRDYADFDGFLATLSSRRRKQIRKERRVVAEAVDAFEWISAVEATPDLLKLLDRHYRSTVASHGGHAYLRPGFFDLVCRYLPDEFLIGRALSGSSTVATASFFQSPSALYGRYWGCDAELRFLHFELAYYRGIERCIDQNIGHFEAGAQGEHKLLRGFEPTTTHSAHWLRHPQLHDAVEQSLKLECLGNARDMEVLSVYGPYKKSE